jgi:hypothetical protein
MLNVSNRSTAAQQSRSECLSQIVGGNICNASSPERGFQCPIVLYRFVSAESTWEYILSVNYLSSIP